MALRITRVGIGAKIAPGWASSCVPTVSLRGAPRLRTCFNLSLRGASRRGNLDEVEHTWANRRCYGVGIATLRSQRHIGVGTPDAGPPGDQRLKGRENLVRCSQAGGSQRRQVLLWRVDVPEQLRRAQFDALRGFRVALRNRPHSLRGLVDGQ